MLNTRPSWGEFIGGTLASLHAWTKEDQQKIMASIKHATAYAAQRGIDH